MVLKGDTVTSRYRKVEVRTWGDEKFRNLSPMPPCGQGLWLFLITGPHTGPIPGLFRAGRAAMAEELGWEIEAFDKAFQEAFQQGMVKADFKARVVWIPNAIKHNRPESPNVVKSWATEFDLIPECDLKREAYEALKASIHALGEAFGKAFDETFVKPLAKPSPKTMPNQEQEQEQEQNIDAPSAAPKSPRGTSLRADWQLPDDWRAWAEAQRPDLDVLLVADAFRDFWIAKPGKDGRKSDWQATWRNWVRNQRSAAGPPAARRQADGVGRFV